MIRGGGGSGDDFAQKVHNGTRRFGQELLDENERLRKLMASVQCEKLLLEESLLAMKEEQFRHERESHRLELQLAEIEIENQRFSDRYLEVERQSSNLANLYVAAYQLHATLDRAVVLTCIQEILSNLVGSEQVAVFEREPSGSTLTLVTSTGIDQDRYRSVSLGTGRIGRVAETGETFVAEAGAEDTGAEDEREDGLSACIPLILDGTVTGAIAIFRLLPQKSAFDDADRELFGLLATHAATALHCAALSEKAGATA